MKNQSRPIFVIIESIAKELAPAYEHDLVLCHQYAWWMVEALIGKSQAGLLAQRDIAFTSEQTRLLESWVQKQVVEHKPLQYILGFVPFGNLQIEVEPPILIPRPETEEWVLSIVEQLSAYKNQPLTILDLCTGTGCIGLLLASQLPQSSVWALDINQQAVSLAKKNAANNHIRNITIIQSDLYTHLDKDIRFDLIVSNPPYIDERSWSTLDASVRNWEDPRALIAPDHGLSIIKEIISHAPARLNHTSVLRIANIPQLSIEIDIEQSHTVIDLMRAAGFEKTHIFVDLESKNRAISACLG